MPHRPTTRSMTAPARNQPPSRPQYVDCECESDGGGAESGSEYQPEEETYTASSRRGGSGVYEYSRTQSSTGYRRLQREMVQESDGDANVNAGVVERWFSTPVPVHECDGMARQPSMTCTRTERAIWAGDRVATEHAERWAYYNSAPPARPAAAVERAECDRQRHIEDKRRRQIEDQRQRQIEDQRRRQIEDQRQRQIQYDRQREYYQRQSDCLREYDRQREEKLRREAEARAAASKAMWMSVFRVFVVLIVFFVVMSCFGLLLPVGAVARMIFLLNFTEW
ncbi:hypothetical protein DENSPDRAFT_879356 [Dentipellis sp. KUC8613]|nr:hypothetical protein DENSPDRAFT_879356 [Dentipellis sp. KUC8613]